MSTTQVCATMIERNLWIDSSKLLAKLEQEFAMPGPDVFQPPKPTTYLIELPRPPRKAT